MCAPNGVLVAAFCVLLIVLVPVLVCAPDGAFACYFWASDCAFVFFFGVGVWPDWAGKPVRNFLAFPSGCSARLGQAADCQFSGFPFACRLPGTTFLVRECGLTDESASGQLRDFSLKIGTSQIPVREGGRKVRSS